MFFLSLPRGQFSGPHVHVLSHPGGVSLMSWLACHEGRGRRGGGGARGPAGGGPGRRTPPVECAVSCRKRAPRLPPPPHRHGKSSGQVRVAFVQVVEMACRITSSCMSLELALLLSCLHMA